MHLKACVRSSSSSIKMRHRAPRIGGGVAPSSSSCIELLTICIDQVPRVPYPSPTFRPTDHNAAIQSRPLVLVPQKLHAQRRIRIVGGLNPLRKSPKGVCVGAKDPRLQRQNKLILYKANMQLFQEERFRNYNSMNNANRMWLVQQCGFFRL